MSDDEKPPDISVFVDTAENFHPYECGSVNCRHCARVETDDHDPETCALCHFFDDLEGF